MAAVKLIILFGIVGIALGFTIPEQEYYNSPSYYYDANLVDELPVGDNVVLIRNARSPQGRIGGSLGRDRDGTSGSVYYTHQLDKNYAIVAEAARHFSRNDNSAMIGLQYNY